MILILDSMLAQNTKYSESMIYCDDISLLTGAGLFLIVFEPSDKYNIQNEIVTVPLLNNHRMRRLAFINL